MRSYLRRIATKTRRALNVLAIAACCCHADPSPLSNDGSPNASVPVALERAGALVVLESHSLGLKTPYLGQKI